MKKSVKVFTIIVLIILIILFVAVLLIFSLSPIKSFDYDHSTNTVTIDGVEYEEVINTNGLLYISYEDLKIYAWSWKNPFGAFFAESYDSPDFIVPSRAATIWFKEGFSYEEQMFRIENTDISFRFSDSYIKDTAVELNDKIELTTFRWYMADTLLCNSPTIYTSYDGEYYIEFVLDGPCYKINDEFLILLVDNDILNV